MLLYPWSAYRPKSNTEEPSPMIPPWSEPLLPLSRITLHENIKGSEWFRQRIPQFVLKVISWHLFKNDVYKFSYRLYFKLFIIEAFQHIFFRAAKCKKNLLSSPFISVFIITPFSCNKFLFCYAFNSCRFYN